MKRIAVWAFYGVGALAVAYLALFAYAFFTGRDLQPGDPIRIFRKPDAPSYSFGEMTIQQRHCERSNDGGEVLINPRSPAADTRPRLPG
ncbi:hypothetical protein [Bradyrhizobium sp.]|uniref:hypothetical protein n=1 Tax=Bradyrhizobium sp. TaxID=376 RepID=UPI003C70E7F0